MITYYFITTVLAVINLIIIIFSFEEKRINYYFTLLMMLIALSNSGYLSISLSSTVSEAVLANKITYLGGCFVPPIVLFAICVICNYRVASWLRNLLYAYSFAVYMMVLTTGFNDFYYTDTYLEQFGNASVLGHEYGIGHGFFYIILYGYMVVEIILLVYSLKKKYAVSRKSLWALILLEIVNIVLFILGRYLNPAVEIMPFMYVVDGWILLYLHHRAIMYNVQDNITSSLEKQENYAYIIFDNQKKYLGCNAIAEKIFPVISGCKVDYKIEGIPQADVILTWLENYCNGNGVVFSYENMENHYECRVDRIWHKEKKCGYIIEIKEDTDKWNYLQLLTSYNDELECQVEEKTRHITEIQSQVLLGMANMVENRDDNTGGHIKRTSDVVRILLETIQENKIVKLNDTLCRDIIRAAPMHDLGKIGIDDKILRKPGKLTEDEFSVMKTHAEKSAILVESILHGVEEEHFVQTAVNIAKYHHEKWNGTGYPSQLAGENIPIEARIMAIADVYDALVSKRCYKDAMSFDKAYEVMMESMGSHFDPVLEQVFLLSRKRLENYYSAS